MELDCECGLLTMVHPSHVPAATAPLSAESGPVEAIGSIVSSVILIFVSLVSTGGGHSVNV